MTAVTDILNNRGNSPRIYRNMLAFLAPDHDLMTNLEQAVRFYLAWKSIKDDSEDLNLDAAQNRETQNNLNRANETVDARIKEAYSWLLVPYIDRNTDIKPFSGIPSLLGVGLRTLFVKLLRKCVKTKPLSKDGLLFSLKWS